MPLYEYVCKACDHEFEREQRITEDPIKTCPKCKADKARRLISRTSFVLKGGGWYSDLYGSSGKDSAGDSGDKGGDKGAKSGKADEKPAKDAPKKDAGTSKGSGGKKPKASKAA